MYRGGTRACFNCFYKARRLKRYLIKMTTHLSPPNGLLKPLRKVNIIEFDFDDLRALRRTRDLFHLSSYLIFMEGSIVEVANIQSFS
jgi:hypothetical protein